MNKVKIFIVIIILAQFTLISCSEDVTGVAGGAGGQGISLPAPAPALTASVLTINGTISNPITIEATSNRTLTVKDESGSEITGAIATFSKTATTTLQEIYTVSVDANNNNAITLTDTEGNSLADTY